MILYHNKSLESDVFEYLVQLYCKPVTVDMMLVVAVAALTNHHHGDECLFSSAIK